MAQGMGLYPRVIAVLILLLACSYLATARVDRNMGMDDTTDDSLEQHARMRSLLVTQLTPQNDNLTYPNASVNVGISHPQGCVPWWSKRIAAGDQVCPKDCELSGFKDGYNLGQLAPLVIQVEKGAVSRVSPHPLKGAYLNVTGQTKLPDRLDFQAISSNNYGLLYVEFRANYDVGASFSASIGLVKKDPALGGLPIADPKAKHDPYCYFNITWTVVAPGSIPAAAAPAAGTPAAAKPPAQAAPPPTAAATKSPAAAAGPAETFDSNGF